MSLWPEQRRDPDAALATPLVLLVWPVALHVHHLVFATALQETREYSSRLYREKLAVFRGGREGMGRGEGEEQGMGRGGGGRGNR